MVDEALGSKKSLTSLKLNQNNRTELPIWCLMSELQKFWDVQSLRFQGGSGVYTSQNLWGWMPLASFIKAMSQTNLIISLCLCDFRKLGGIALFIFFICSEFCHKLKWNSHGFTCVPHPDPPSHLPLPPLPLGFPSAPGPSTCLMHPTWAGDLFHPR